MLTNRNTFRSHPLLRLDDHTQPIFSSLAEEVHDHIKASSHFYEAVDGSIFKPSSVTKYAKEVDDHTNDPSWITSSAVKATWGFLNVAAEGANPLTVVGRTGRHWSRTCIVSRLFTLRLPVDSSNSSISRSLVVLFLYRFFICLLVRLCFDTYTSPSVPWSFHVSIYPFLCFFVTWSFHPAPLYSFFACLSVCLFLWFFPTSITFLICLFIGSFLCFSMSFC